MSQFRPAPEGPRILAMDNVPGPPPVDPRVLKGRRNPQPNGSGAGPGSGAGDKTLSHLRQSFVRSPAVDTRRSRPAIPKESLTKREWVAAHGHIRAPGVPSQWH